MSRRLFGSLGVLFMFAFLLPGQARASGPTNYFSTGVGGQIISVDGSANNTTSFTVVFNSATATNLQGITVGPDGMIYACDTLNGKILSLDPAGLSNQTPTVVYDKIASSSVANQPQHPQALRFNGLDLYFTDQDTAPSGGVWKLPGVTTATLPENPTQIFAAGATGATLQGTAFSSPGGLLIVDQVGNRILKSPAPYTTAPITLIQNPNPCGGESQPVCLLAAPVGIAVKSNGHIFVANSGASLHNINEFDAAGTFIQTFVASFPGTQFHGPDTPRHIGFDLSDNLYVVTAQNATGDDGKVWRVAPSGTITLVFDLEPFFCDDGQQNCVPLPSPPTADLAIGLAVPATSVVSPAQDFTSTSLSGTFDFGSDKMVITFPSVTSSGSLSVTKKEVTLAEFATLAAANFPGIPCTHYSREGGFCDVYVVSRSETLAFTLPVNIQLFYFTQDALADPVLLRAPDASAMFTETVPLVGFTTQGGGNDPGMSGDSGGTSQYAAANQPLPARFQNDAFCGFASPIPPGKTFLAGQTVPVKFRIASSAANCNKGVFVTNARMQLGVVDQNGVFQVVQSANTRDNRNCPNGPTPCNVFSVVSNQYIFNLSTIGYAGGGTTYFVTIFGEGVPPQTTSFTLQ